MSQENNPGPDDYTGQSPQSEQDEQNKKEEPTPQSPGIETPLPYPERYNQPSYYETPGNYGPPPVYIPPQQEYNHQQQSYAYSQPPAQPLSEAVKHLYSQYIHILRHPKPQTFADELPKARWNITLFQIGLMMVLAAIYGLIFAATYPSMIDNFLSLAGTSNPAIHQQETIIHSFYSGPFLLFSALEALISIPISIFIFVGIQFGLGRLFKGQGTFLQQTYTYLLFQTPISILSYILNSLLFFIPFVGIILGFFISFGLSIYGLFLNISQVQSSQKLNINRAIGVVLIPYAILFVLGIILYIFIIIFAIFIVTMVTVHH